MERMSRDDGLGRLRAHLEREAPEPGARLPTERALAAAIGCSRETPRAGLERLEAEGLVWRHVGQGTFAGPRPRGRPIRDTALLGASSAAERMEARLVIEPPVAGEAARRATPEDAAHLRARAEAGRAARDRPACEVADDAFHTAIAEVAGNRILIGVLRYLAGARRRAPWQREWERDLPPRRRGRVPGHARRAAHGRDRGRRGRRPGGGRARHARAPRGRPGGNHDPRPPAGGPPRNLAPPG